MLGPERGAEQLRILFPLPGSASVALVLLYVLRNYRIRHLLRELLC